MPPPAFETLSVTHEFDIIAPDIAEKLRPTYEAICGVQQWVSEKLVNEGIAEGEINTYLDGKQVLAPRLEMSPFGERFKEVASQYEHIRQVNETTFLLKKWLIEHKLPERTVAYQLGTGFPLPEENERCVRKGFLPYENQEKEGGVLRHFRRPGEAGHSEDSGMYIYEITSLNGNKATLLAIKGREHGYAKTGKAAARLDLARMGRVLNGVGSEIILATFAVGVDVLNITPGTFNAGDYAVLLGSDDLSGMRSYQDPGSGDQTLVGQLYGGPFGSDANRQPHRAWYRKFIEAVKNAHNKTSEGHLPNVHPAYGYDAISIPHFEGAGAAVLPKIITNSIVSEGIISTDELRQEFGEKELITLATAQGMNITTEWTGYFRMQPTSWGGHPSIFNRSLPVLPIVGYTDTIDPRPSGESRLISHKRVLKAGEKSARFIAPVITNFFTKLIDKPWQEMAKEEEGRIASEIFSDLKDRPSKLEDIRDLLERRVAFAEALTTHYRLWGINEIADSFENEAGLIESILESTNDSTSRKDYDYFIQLRGIHIKRARDMLVQGVESTDQSFNWHRDEAWRAETAVRIIADGKKDLIQHKSFHIDIAIYQQQSQEENPV